ncbi:hypothetical protein MMC12_005054 [Toensbergia leucococca]|nr:hypothetical protein [Toensbergia leucococca]
MSDSPPKEMDVEAGAPSPANSEMDRGDPDPTRELAYEFDVKEQDRWLPIANGWLFMHQRPPMIFEYLAPVAAQ